MEVRIREYNRRRDDLTLNVRHMRVMSDMNRGRRGFVGRWCFSSLSFLTGNESLELLSELFPVSRRCPENAIHGDGMLRGRRSGLGRGHLLGAFQRTGSG